jgi:ABC-type lipoprotein export system ATPase subunit
VVGLVELKPRTAEEVKEIVLQGNMRRTQSPTHESGAGKTTLLNVLAMRTDTGVVTGDRFVNGQSLPADFQSQSYVVFLLLFRGG